tara:strand:- start:1531 stop:1680 length:150 start_codon:yes stop_codon:yes gene_type:complete
LKNKRLIIIITIISSINYCIYYINNYIFNYFSVDKNWIKIKVKDKKGHG